MPQITMVGEGETLAANSWSETRLDRWLPSSRNVQNHCLHKNIYTYIYLKYTVYCLMFREYHVNVYKLPWGKSFFGFLTMIHPDRHATDRGKYFFSNQTFQPMVLVVKSC